MGIYARPNSPYWWANLDGTKIRLSLKIHVHGATPEQTKEFKQLAEATYRAMMGDVARARFELPLAAMPRTFDAHADWYDTHHTAHHKAAAQERSVLGNLRRVFGRDPLEAIVPSRWQEYVTTRTKDDGVAPITLWKELGILKCVLNTAVGDYLTVSPLAHVKRKQPRRPAKRTISAKEEPAFVQALRRLDVELADMYVVGVGTLLRQRNLVDLQRSSHRDDRLVVQTKTGPHQVPLRGPTVLQRRAATVLRRRMPSLHGGFFFPDWQAKFAKAEPHGAARGALRELAKAAATDANLPWGLANAGIVWHTATRASGATRLLREHHVDIRTVQLLGNWSSLDQMAGYLGMDPQHFDRVRW